MGKQGFARIASSEAVFRLCMCLMLVGVVIFGAADRTAAASTAASLPEIRAFNANPLILPDGGHAVYMFEVYDATKIQVVEAGEIINEYSGPPATTSKGQATGRTTYQIRSGSGNTFEAILIARNAGGEQKKTLTLSFETKRQPKAGSLIPPVSDIATAKKKEGKLGPQTLVPAASIALSTLAPWPHQFAKCPSGCYACLKPEDAAARGLARKCLDQPCYFSPDKQQYWYCYGEPEGWCCKDGKITPATQLQCKESAGDWYATEAEAMKACESAECWCCTNGRYGQTTADACAKTYGTCYATQAQASERCLASGWFCSSGKVYQGSQSQATQAGATLYATEAEAIKACESAECWCCTNGRYGQTTSDACVKMGGTCYATQAQAVERCQPLGWYCSGGMVYQGTSSQAAQAGAAWYATQAEATRACAVPLTCWCCTNGRYGQTTTVSCANMGGTCYATQAQASERCQTLGGCCVNYNVSQTTSTQCAQMGGKWYSSVTEAQRVCVPPVTYYCCSNGQVYQSRTPGAGCYTSPTEAQRACTPTVTYWCCSNGQVYQSKTPGRGCYTSQAEAQKACTVYTPPIAPPTRYPLK